MIVTLTIAIVLIIVPLLVELSTVWFAVLFFSGCTLYGVSVLIWEFMKDRVKNLEKKVEALMNPFKED